MSNSVYLVEAIRYGSEALGVLFYGVFNDLNLIHTKMSEYNVWRGGKYPVYRVLPMELNPLETQSNHHSKYMYFDVKDLGVVKNREDFL